MSTARRAAFVLCAMAGCAPARGEPPASTDVAETRGGETFQRITYTNARGATVHASLLAPRGRPSRAAGVVLQRDIGQQVEELTTRAQLLARAGGVVLLPEWALGGQGHPSDDAELWHCAAEDVRRAYDVLAARDDVDAQRLAFVGFGFGGSVGAIVATIDPRVRALVLVDPEGDARAGSTSSLRGHFDARYVGALAPSERLRRAPRHAPLLIQFGTAERALSDEDLATWTAAVGAGDGVKWYASSCGPEARTDLVAWLASAIGLDAKRMSAALQVAR
jgi:dienelactone hydrolase